MQLSEKTDEDLMSEYQLGSENAFSVLYARHSGKVLAFIRKRIKDTQKVSEVYQEVFVKMHKSKHLYNRTLPYLPWLFSISRSVVLDSLRLDSRRIIETTEKDFENFAPHEKSPNLIELEPHLASLNSTQRIALEMRYVDEKTFEEIASILKTSPVNVRQLISRGLKRLRELVVEGESHERRKE